MINQNEELIDRYNKMAFFLGMAVSTLLELKNDPFISAEVKCKLIPLVEKLVSGIDELFYNAEPIKKPTQEPYTKEWQGRCKVCKKYHIALEPCTWAPNCS